MQKFFRLKWFIKYPNEIHLLNYFARPFNENLWRAIHLTVIIGGLLTAIIQYSHSQVKKISHEFNLGNSIFAACDAFLNQGSEISDKASFRMAFIIFRFTALFIFPAYMADLTALLSIRKPEIEFQNLVEFSKNGKYKMLLPNGGNYIRVYFEVSEKKCRGFSLDFQNIRFIAKLFHLCISIGKIISSGEAFHVLKNYTIRINRIFF